MTTQKDQNKTHFIILRVTAKEKDYLQKNAIKERKNLSKFIRTILGFE
jgi:uncharacterized protein (DUF1778 family)